MPRPIALKPALCHHKRSGRAYVTIDGKQIYLGAHGSQAARDEYDRLIGEWISRGRTNPTAADDPSKGLTVSQVIAAFWKHAVAYYGPNSGETDNFKEALKPLRRLYGPTAAVAFGPLAFKALRERCIELGWARTYINRQMARVRQVFKWAVEQELIPPSIYHGLIAVAALKRGKTAAKETEPVKPAADSHIDAVLPFLSRQVAGMIQLQRHTGARPGEIVILRTCDIDTDNNGLIWYIRKTAGHKTAHHGITRTIRIGPQGKEIIKPFLRTNLDEYLFQPGEAEAERRAKMSEERKTPIHRGNRPGHNQSRAPRRKPGECYDVHSYRRCIARACDEAFPPPASLARLKDETKEEWLKRLAPRQILELRHWQRQHRFRPNQIRHSFATAVRRQFGIEMSQTLIGHKVGSTITEIYAEANDEGADAIIAKIG